MTPQAYVWCKCSNGLTCHDVDTLSKHALKHTRVSAVALLSTQNVFKCQSAAALAEDLVLACLTCTGASYASWLLTASVKPIQASLKRKHEEVSEEKADAIRTRVKVDLDVKEQEEQAKSDAKTQVRL